MKQLLHLWILWIPMLCFGQQTYKINAGELDFIHPKEGIFIKKNNNLFQLRVNDISDDKVSAKGFKYELEKTTLEDVERIKKDVTTIFATQITNNFKKLDQTSFTTKVADDDNFRLVKLNKDFISIAILEDSLQKPRNEYVFPYCIFDFGSGKKIICHQEGFIIPTKEKLHFLFANATMNKAFKHYSFEDHKKWKPAELHLQTSDLELNRDFYKTDTLKNKKVVIKNRFNQIVIKKEFDSIKYNSFFIIGYKNKKINLYNYTFEELKIRNVRAFYFNKFYPMLQILQQNKLRNINLIGADFKNEDLSYLPGFNHFFPDNTVFLKVTKEQNQFYLETDNIDAVASGLRSFESKFKIINSDAYDSIEFLNEKTFITLYSEMGNYTVKYPLLMYTKLKNGKYNLNTIESLIDSDIDDKSKEFNALLPKNLDSIASLNGRIYLIERNGLLGYYPLNRDVRYKILEKFQNNFARFELPNGKKGWLSLDGHEYLDE